MVIGSATPIGTDVPAIRSGGTRPSVEFTVASVGPYALNMRRPRPQRATSSGDDPLGAGQQRRRAAA